MSAALVVSTVQQLVVDLRRRPTVSSPMTVLAIDIPRHVDNVPQHSSPTHRSTAVHRYLSSACRNSCHCFGLTSCGPHRCSTSSTRRRPAMALVVGTSRFCTRNIRQLSHASCFINILIYICIPWIPLLVFVAKEQQPRP